MTVPVVAAGQLISSSAWGNQVAADVNELLRRGPVRDPVTNAIVGIAQATANQAGITTNADLTGLTITYTFDPARLYRITLSIWPQSTVAGDTARAQIMVGVNIRQQFQVALPVAAQPCSVERFVYLNGPGLAVSGSLTVQARLARQTGTGTITNVAGAVNPSLMVIEDMGAV